MTRDTEQTVQKCKFANGACIHCKATERGDCQGWVSSPKREWVGLTDEDFCDQDHQWAAGASWAEAKLKERNNG
jgi:hypothetical protein